MCSGSAVATFPFRLAGLNVNRQVRKGAAFVVKMSLDAWAGGVYTGLRESDYFAGGMQEGRASEM